MMTMLTSGGAVASLWWKLFDDDAGCADGDVLEECGAGGTHGSQARRCVLAGAWCRRGRVSEG